MRPGRFGIKLERAIAQQAMLVDSLIQKQQLLEAMASPEYVQAANYQKEISKLLLEAEKDKKQACFKILQAQEQLNQLQKLLGKTANQKIIQPKIQQMFAISSEKIHSSLGQDLLTLDRESLQLRNELLDVVGPPPQQKMSGKIAVMLSKELALLPYLDTPPKLKKMDDIRHLFQKIAEDSSLLRSVFSEAQDISDGGGVLLRKAYYDSIGKQSS